MCKINKTKGNKSLKCLYFFLVPNVKENLFPLLCLAVFRCNVPVAVNLFSISLKLMHIFQSLNKTLASFACQESFLGIPAAITLNVNTSDVCIYLPISVSRCLATSGNILLVLEELNHFFSLDKTTNLYVMDCICLLYKSMRCLSIFLQSFQQIGYDAHCSLV